MILNRVKSVAELRRSAPGKAPDMRRVAGAGARLSHPEVFLDPDTMGDRILAAVRADELSVITHPQWLALVRERHAAVESAFERAAARWPD